MTDLLGRAARGRRVLSLLYAGPEGWSAGGSVDFFLPPTNPIWVGGPNRHHPIDGALHFFRRPSAAARESSQREDESPPRSPASCARCAGSAPRDGGSW